MREAGLTQGRRMAQTMCAINNLEQRWKDGQQKCAKIYECEAKKCVEGWEEWGTDARNRIGSCVVFFVLCLSVCQQIFSFSSFNLLFLYSTVQKSAVVYSIRPPGRSER